MNGDVRSATLRSYESRDSPRLDAQHQSTVTRVHQCDVSATWPRNRDGMDGRSAVKYGADASARKQEPEPIAGRAG
jgi:hypothetical protein